MAINEAKLPEFCPGRENDPSPVRPIEARHLNGIPLVDRSLVEELVGLLGPDLRSIYMNYFLECSLSIDLLEIEAANGDPVRAGGIAHQMLGASSTLGMLQLAAAFTTLETTTADLQLPWQEWIVETRELLIRSMQAINEADFGPPGHGC